MANLKYAGTYSYIYLIYSDTSCVLRMDWVWRTLWKCNIKHDVHTPHILNELKKLAHTHSMRAFYARQMWVHRFVTIDRRIAPRKGLALPAPWPPTPRVCIYRTTGLLWSWVYCFASACVLTMAIEAKMRWVRKKWLVGTYYFNKRACLVRIHYIAFSGPHTCFELWSAFN